MMQISQLGQKALAGAFAILLGLGAASCSTASGDRPESHAGQASQAGRSISVQAGDGMADAMLFTPSGAAGGSAGAGSGAGSGPWPGVVLWADLTGLRPQIAEIGQALADEGFVVLAPNAFYRNVKLDGGAALAQPPLPFGETMQRGAPWRAGASDEAVMADTRAFVAYLDGLPQVDKARAISAVGIDIGGAHAMIGARAAPGRIGAVAALYPLAIATSRDTSPHLYVRQSQARYFIAIAQNDDAREPQDKDDLAKAFGDAGLAADVAIIPADHGFMMADDAAWDRTARDAVWARTIAFLRDKAR